MENSNMMDAAKKVFEILEPLSTDDRQRVINAAFAFLGDVFKQKAPVPDDEGVGGLTLQPKARRWMKDNGIEAEMLEAYLHLDESNSEVVDVPGTTAKDRTINGYLLIGILALLTTGSGNFTDQAARDFCKKNGSYSEKHHSEYMKDARGLWAGSKKSGWILTAKGLKAAAVLINPPTKE